MRSAVSHAGNVGDATVAVKRNLGAGATKRGTIARDSIIERLQREVYPFLVALPRRDPAVPSAPSRSHSRYDPSLPSPGRRAVDYRAIRPVDMEADP